MSSAVQRWCLKNLFLSSNGDDTSDCTHNPPHFLPFYIYFLVSHSNPEGNVPTLCLWGLNFCYLLCPSMHLTVSPVNTKLRELTVAPLTKSSPKWTISSPFLSNWVGPWTTFHFSCPHPNVAEGVLGVVDTLAHHQQKLPGLCLGLSTSVSFPSSLIGKRLLSFMEQYYH